MATGYTCDVADGKVTDFRTFALRCARAFGACIMRRDDAPNEPPKHREPDDYHTKALAKAEARMAELKRMRTADIEAAAEQDYRDELQRYEESLVEKGEKHARYAAMLTEINAWQPPTPDHEKYKAFMVEQITSSIDWDCKPWDEDVWPRPKRLTPKEWMEKAIAKAQWNIDYHTRHHAEELERCRQANAWIDALYASLPDSPTVVAAK